MVVICGCSILLSGRDLGEDEVNNSKKVRRIVAKDDNDGATAEVPTDGEPVGRLMDEGAVGGEPSGMGPTDRCGSTEAVSAGEYRLDTQGEPSSGGRSEETTMKKGKEKERAPLEALLLPRTKRRKIDPKPFEEVDGCGLVQQRTSASRKKQRKRKRGQGEQL